MRELARAKVNLSLHVVGKRDDGFHLLDSIIVFPDVADELELVKKGFSISGPFGKGLPKTGNLVQRAAEFLGYEGGILLEKNLPVASGIGGGSADAAAALRLISRVTGQALPDGAALGADVPACLLSKPLRMQGVGERLTPLPPLPDFFILLVNAGAAVSTPRIFRALKNVNNPAGSELPQGLSTSGFFEFLATQRNDMQAAAIEACPTIADVLAALRALPDCALSRMSGSGGTCFGLFYSAQAAHAAATALKNARPDWWVVAARG
ncbi:MAG: 4-(cytidine 5'-diphospho)-2-C-methyl-D-erythritol kinase [Rhodobacteraceae bacterium]|nr:4-(cytidine 5'-diphospho)-2-C-methyl-D-erythritol kinase [Paracoccaceae bacterium]